jgi:hypothetical protein
MATAVLALLRDERAALRMTRDARRVAETYSWSSVRDQWTEVYSGRSVDAAPAAEDGNRRVGRQKPAGSLEVAREERYEEPAVARAR